VLGAAIAAPFVYSAGKKAGFVEPPAFHQITFSRGEVGAALFAPDGQTIVYSASWEGKPWEVFINRPESPESRPFGLGTAEVLAISKSGEMAVSLNRRQLRPFMRTGRLARISIAGGAPRDILDDVQLADWGPDGQSLAIVRDVGIKNRLEYPIGKGALRDDRLGRAAPRFARRRRHRLRRSSFPERRWRRISVVDKAGKKRDLTPVYATVQGLVWTPDGKEIWYTAAEGGFNRAVHAVTLSGKLRLVGRVPGISTIRDISKDGRVLMTNESARSASSSADPARRRTGSCPGSTTPS
jgi:Tol biopolymer transport system component